MSDMPKCFLPSANPRLNSCLRCGKLSCRPGPDQPVKESVTVKSGAEDGTEAVTGPIRMPSTSEGGASSNAGLGAVLGAPVDDTRPRDIPLERELTQLAAQAAGHADDHGLRDFADARAWPGGVRGDLDFRREACEEAADLSSYAVWQVEAVYEDAMAGVPEALDRYEWGMRVLSKTVDLWRELLTDAA